MQLLKASIRMQQQEQRVQITGSKYCILSWLDSVWSTVSNSGHILTTFKNDNNIGANSEQY